jgi:hypothetical protein
MGGQLGGDGTYLRIPHTETKGAFFNVLEHNGSWPGPLVHQIKELGDNSSTVSEGVQLAYASNHDGPRNSSRVTEDSAVDAATVRPQLDSP